MADLPPARIPTCEPTPRLDVDHPWVTVSLPDGDVSGDLLDLRRGRAMATEDGGDVQHVRITVRVHTKREDRA